MNFLSLSTDFIFIFIFSLLFLLLSRKIAQKIDLLDKPNYRKNHYGQIPLVGGISVYAGIFFASIYTGYHISNRNLFLICTGILVIIGIIDDKFNISVIIRVFVQALVAILMMLFSGCYINSLGYIFGPWREIDLGYFGYLVTLFFVWIIINAFNMIDGIDGLLGGLSYVSLGAICIQFILNDNLNSMLWCLAVIISILPYILLNIGIFGNYYKVFMGDSGSTMIGFIIIWILLQNSHGWGYLMNPVTVLWILAIPLMDIIFIMYKRISNGINPCIPDRQHIHHYLIVHTGFSARKTSIIITCTATFLAGFGIIGERWLCLPESIMFLLWIGMFFLYSYTFKQN